MLVDPFMLDVGSVTSPAANGQKQVRVMRVLPPADICNQPAQYEQLKAIPKDNASRDLSDEGFVFFSNDTPPEVLKRGAPACGSTSLSQATVRSSRLQMMVMVQGKTIMAEVPAGATVAQFECLVVARTTGLPLGAFSLYYGGRPLYTLEWPGTIDLKTRGRGGGMTPRQLATDVAAAAPSALPERMSNTATKSNTATTSHPHCVFPGPLKLRGGGSSLSKKVVPVHASDEYPTPEVSPPIRKGAPAGEATTQSAKKAPEATWRAPATIMRTNVSTASVAHAEPSDVAASASHTETEVPAASLQLSGLPQGLRELFKQIDVDNSGSVDQEEFLAFALPSGADYERISQLWLQLLGGQAAAVAAEMEAMKDSLQVVLAFEPMHSLLLPTQHECSRAHP